MLKEMHIKVLAFGVLKERLGDGPIPVELPEGSTVADLLIQIENGTKCLRGIAVSVNAEYARPGDVLRAGDEVGLLPPVSGGSGPELAAMAMGVPPGRVPVIFIELRRDPIDSEALIRQAKDAEDGAVVVFDGIVRNNSRGRRTLFLDYEAYEEMAVAKLDALAAEARERFGVRFVSIVHRLGRLEIGETSVLIVVAAAHRAQAYEASRFLIDMLKKTVPIWKKETFEDGAVWADGEPFPQGIEIAEADQGA
jgi:MoaE-MoaD fusion protein